MCLPHLSVGAELRASWKASREIYDFVRFRIDRGETVEAILTAGKEAGFPADWMSFYTNTTVGEVSLLDIGRTGA